MGQFTAQLFKDLAAAADHRFVDKRTERLTDDSDIAGFKKKDIADLQEFRIAVFKLLMWRAAAFIDGTNQESSLSDEVDRFAEVEFKMMLNTRNVHRDKEFRKYTTFGSVIPNAVAPDIYDSYDLEIGKLVDGFGGNNPIYLLACKKT